MTTTQKQPSGPACPVSTNPQAAGVHAGAATLDVPLVVTAQLSEHMRACSLAPGIIIAKGDSFYKDALEIHGETLADMARAQGFEAKCEPAGRQAIGRFTLVMRKPRLIVPPLNVKSDSRKPTTEIQGT